PLAEKTAVETGVRQEEVAAGLVVDHLSGLRLEQFRDLRSAVAYGRGQPSTVQRSREPWFVPSCGPGPVPPQREGGEQPSIFRAAEDHRPVRDRVDVLPEGVAGPERGHRAEIVVEAGSGNGYSRCRRPVDH